MRWWDVFFVRTIVVSVKIAAQSTAVGAIIGALRSSGETLVVDTLFGALIGFVISAGCLVVEFKLFSNQRYRLIRRLRPILLMALRGAAFSFIIIFGMALPGFLSDALPLWQDPAFAEVFVLSIAIAYAFSIGFEITRLLGPEATIALIWGRYNQARLENRVIIFADVVGSTALAEEVGQLRFHDFLRDVALDIAGPVEMAGGGIHKYVGDAVIITWPFAKGVFDGACL